MGKMKRARVQQVDEFSMQKLRTNHETIQQLTSHLQQMQEQMNSMNSSENSRNWNRITVRDCRTFPVNMQ